MRPPKSERNFFHIYQISELTGKVTGDKDDLVLLWTPIFLLGLGISLLFIEIVLLPGFGAAGVPGIVLICIGIGVVWSEHGIEAASVYGSAAIVVTIPLSILGLWLAPRTKIGRTVILDVVESSANGFQAPPKELANLVGQSGQSLSSLRPAGAALIDSRRVDVVTCGEFIEPETDVEVILVEGSRVVVRGL